jgi:hypothetical protein
MKKLCTQSAAPQPSGLKTGHGELATRAAGLGPRPLDPKPGLERAGEAPRKPASGRRRPGQALVELALVSTLIFFLLSAAIDVGLLYLAYQALANAAEEGVMYGSLMPVENVAGGTGVSPNDEQIMLRIRNESYSPGLANRVGVVDLLDLNSDGIDDINQQAVIDEHIQISAARNQLAPPQESCASRRSGMCEIQVRLSFDYKTFFFLAPAIGSGTVTVAVERSATIHHLNVK